MSVTSLAFGVLAHVLELALWYLLHGPEACREVLLFLLLFMDDVEEVHLLAVFLDVEALTPLVQSSVHRNPVVLLLLLRILNIRHLLRSRLVTRYRRR